VIEKIKKKLHAIIYALVLKERSPEKLSRSISLALYLSFAPWIGMQAPLIFILPWFFQLNTAVMVTVAFSISNPWTYVPICTLDYVVGYWLLHSFLKFDVAAINPSWMTWINEYLAQKVSIVNASFWAFIVGGNIVALTLAFGSYPLTLYIFRRFGKK
jgi:uncharacterized protein (DUF2062 family)